MRKYTKADIILQAKSIYIRWVSVYSLNNAMKIHAELGRLLRAEKKRREAIDHK